MQKCKKCGKDIKYVAIGNSKNIVCNAEKLQFVTENNRITFGYLVHQCENKLEKENEQRSDNGRD